MDVCNCLRVIVRNTHFPSYYTHHTLNTPSTSPYTPTYSAEREYPTVYGVRRAEDAIRAAGDPEQTSEQRKIEDVSDLVCM